MRLYAWRLKTRHMKFLDLAFDLGLVVSSAFEMGTAEDTPIGTAQELQPYPKPYPYPEP